MVQPSQAPTSKGYKPIEDYGIISDLHTIALVPTGQRKAHHGLV